MQSTEQQQPAPCPNCGHCPTCGHTPQPQILPLPVHPWQPYQPWVWPNTTGTQIIWNT